jgi:hypothetical protein
MTLPTILAPLTEGRVPRNQARSTASATGATAISASVAAPSIEAGLLRQVNFPLPDREFHVLRHRERYKSLAAEALLAMVATSPASRIRAD